MQQYSSDQFCCVGGCVRWSPGTYVVQYHYNSNDCTCIACGMYVVQDISQEENTALSIVSYIGCGISIICLLIVIIVLVYYRLVTSQVCEDCISCNCGICRNTVFKGIHNFVHLNLPIALIFALLVFVGGTNLATNNEVSLQNNICHYYSLICAVQVGCKVVAVLLQYLFTAVFSWMLCEGIVQYFLLVKVFNTGLGERKLFYLVVGWGEILMFLF